MRILFLTAIAMAASFASAPDARANDNTFNTWALCIWGDDRSFTKPIKVQCLKVNKFREKMNVLVDASQWCKDKLGADRVKAGFSENGMYASGPTDKFRGNGRSLCAAYCKTYAAGKSNATCDDRMIVPK